MAITAGEQQSGGEVRDTDGRLIVTGPGGVAIGGGGGGTDPLSDGTPGGGLPSKTLWIAGANGAVLQGLVVDGSGRLRTVVEGTPAVSVSNFPATQPVSGSVGVSNFPASQAVTGTFFQGTQPVSGPLTDTQLRATAVPVSGTFFQATQPVSLTALPALAAGANTIGKADQGAGGASAWKVDGSAVTQPVSLAAVPTVTERQDQQAAVATTWTSATSLNATTATYAVTGYGTINVGVLAPSTTTAGAVQVEGTQNGTDWTPLGNVRQDNSYPENPVALAFLPGTNGFRVYAASTEAFTQVRAKLTTAIVGAGNVVVTITSVAGGVEPIVAQRSRKVATYRAVFRSAARSYTLSNAFAAAGRKQYATIHHPAASTKTVRLRRAAVFIHTASAATDAVVELVRVTAAPATGNPAITTINADSADSAAEATCLALPTTAGTEAAAPYAQVMYHAGITGAAPTTSPPTPTPWVDLLSPSTFDDESKAPVIRAGVLEGWAITVDSNQIATLTANVFIEFTEENA